MGTNPAPITATTSIDTSGFQSGLAIIKEQYSQASTEVRQSVQRIVDAEKQATEAIAAGHTALGASLQGAANVEREALNGLIAKQLELKAAVEQANAALGHQVSAVVAAGAEMRVLEGAMPIRAAEQFISRIQGVGPLLQAAFPVFGAVALGEVLVHMGEAAYELYQKFDPLAQAEKRATEEAKAYDAELKQIKASMQALQDQQFELLFGKTALLAEKSARMTNDEVQARLRVKAIEDEIAEKRKEAAATVSNPTANYGGGMVAVPALREQAAALKDIETLTRELTVAQDELAKKQLEASVLTTQMLQSQEADREKQIAGINRVAKEADRAAEEEQQYQLERRNEIARQQEEFYRQQAEEEAKAAKERENARLESLQAEIAEIAEHYREASEAIKRGTEEEKKAQEEARRLAVADVQADSAGKVGDLEVQRATLQKPSGIGQSAQAEVAYLEALKAIDQQIIAEKQQAALQVLQIDAAAVSASASLGIDAQKDAERRMLDGVRALEEINRQGQIRIANDTKAILAQQQAQYQQFFATINRDFNASFSQWLTGHKTFVASMNQLWTKMVSDFTGSLIQMGLKFAEQQTVMTIANAIGITTRTQAAAAGSAAQATFAGVAAAAQIQVYAAEASAATYAALSPIPIIGPGLAAVAAPAVYYTVEALGSGLAAFETGGIIPNTGVALVHQGEAVLPAPLTQTLMNASGGGGTTINGGVHIHTPTADPKQHAADFASQLRRLNLKMA